MVRHIENLKVGDNVYNLSTNIGVYKLTNGDRNISEIMDRAIMAHSASKGDAFEKFRIVDEKIEKELESESKIEHEMYQALKDKEFKVFYQPKFNAKEETLYGAEALVRWEHKGKMIPPSEFIPLFEKNKFTIKNCSIKVLLRLIEAGNFLDSVKIILNSISYLYKILIRKQRLLYYL